MALTTAIVSIIKLPLSLAGRVLGAVTGRASSPETVSTPPTDVPAAPASSVVKKSSPAAKTSPPRPTRPPRAVEPMPPSGTAIDAAADAEDVDVTPADLAKVMGTQLGEDSSTTR